MQLPKGFGKNYFNLAAIQAYMSLKKIMALSASVCTLTTKPLRIVITSPPPFKLKTITHKHFIKI